MMLKLMRLWLVLVGFAVASGAIAEEPSAPLVQRGAVRLLGAGTQLAIDAALANAGEM